MVTQEQWDKAVSRGAKAIADIVDSEVFLGILVKAGRQDIQEFQNQVTQAYQDLADSMEALAILESQGIQEVKESPDTQELME